MNQRQGLRESPRFVSASVGFTFPGCDRSWDITWVEFRITNISCSLCLLISLSFSDSPISPIFAARKPLSDNYVVRIGVLKAIEVRVGLTRVSSVLLLRSAATVHRVASLEAASGRTKASRFEGTSRATCVRRRERNGEENERFIHSSGSERASFTHCTCQDWPRLLRYLRDVPIVALITRKLHRRYP